MLDFSKRWGPAFLAAFAVLIVGIVPVFLFLKDSPCLMLTLIIIFSVIAIICLIFAIIIALFYDLRDVCRRKREKKREDSHKALAESFKKAHPEWTEKQVEIAATGRTEPYLPIDGLDDDGWITPREAYEKSCQKKK